MTLATGALALAGCAPRAATPELAAFEANLAAHDSATEALRQWCAARGIADAPAITAQLVRGRDEPPPPALRAQLAVGADEPLGYRHVRLHCGEIVLSEAHNWFVPARLTPAMNAALAGTDIPFGRIAGPLRFTREPLGAARRGDPACPADAISTHRALLRLPDGRPLALVSECYTAANLGAASRPSR